MMKRWMVFLLGALILSITGICPAQDDVASQSSCKYCGMDRKTFAHSRMLVTYEDGSSIGTCSIHCAAIELAVNIDKTPKTIEVGDFRTKKLINAEKASWVLGGGKPGVMTKQAKWAFEDKASAEKFINENGGKMVSFDEAIKTSYEDMYADTKMIREKRKMKRAGQHKH